MSKPLLPIRSGSGRLHEYRTISPQMGASCGLADDAKRYRVALGDLPKDTPIELPRVFKFPERPKGEPLFPPGPWESIKNLPNP
jgi:hypothetical protein